MYLSDSFRSSVQNILTHKLRSLLTLSAIIIGIFAVVIMFSSVSGIKKLVTESMEQLGWNNSVIILIGQTPQRTGRRVSGAGERFMHIPRPVKPLTIHDYHTLKREVDHKYLYAMIDSWSRLHLRDRQENIRLRATTRDFFDSRSYTITKGRFFNGFEENTAQKVAVIGQYTADKFYPDSDPLEDTITVGNNRFRIIGVVSTAVVSSDVGMDFGHWNRQQDFNAVYIPLSTGARYIKQGNEVDQLYIQSHDDESYSRMVTRARQTLMANHNMGHYLHFGDVGSVMFRINQEIEDNMRKWNITLTAIASISLIVGGLGLFSTMLISINERMMEIGIRKSVGATSKDIFLHFIVEALLLALIGALIGISLALFMLRVVSVAINFSFPIVVEGIVLGIAFAFIIGFLSGFYPAFKASETNPIQAIYYNE